MNWGNFWKAILSAFGVKFEEPKREEPIKKPELGPTELKVIGMPWVKWFTDRIGWTEFSHDKELSKGWKYTNVPDYKTVIGSNYAWCAMSLNTALEVNGFVGTKNAAARSFIGKFTKCEPRKGAIIVLEHAHGGHHVTIFDSWTDGTKQYARCIGGNQQNSIRYSVFDVSGNDKGEDEIVWACWPIRK